MAHPTAEIEWIPVTEPPPEDWGSDRRYLVASPSTVFMARRYGDHWINVAVHLSPTTGEPALYSLGGITHWAELPVLPSHAHKHLSTEEAEKLRKEVEASQPDRSELKAKIKERWVQREEK